MAPGTTHVWRCNHEVLKIISGRSAVKAGTLIAEELENHKPLLLDGLLFYKPHSEEAEKKLTADKNVVRLERRFLLQLSQFLDLDALQCKELFEAYVLSAFRGTGAQLQSIMKDERSVQALLQKVWEYYHTERMMLLHCIKHLFSFHTDEDHLYQEQYFGCVSKLEEQKVFDRLLKQYETSFNSPVPSRHKRGPLMSERHSIRWCMQGLREQCELLEIILLYIHGLDDSTQYLLPLAQLFQKQGFGTRQLYRYLLDAEDLAHHLTARIGFLCGMLLVTCMNLHMLTTVPEGESVPVHTLTSNQKQVGELTSIFQSLRGQQAHGPVLLAWGVLNATLWPDREMPLGIKLGQQAARLQVFRYMAAQLGGLPSKQNSVLSLLCDFVVYILLTKVLSVFNYLGGQQDLIELACQLLKQPHLCEEFWQSDIDGGIFSLLRSSITSFPSDFNPLLKLLTPLASEGSRRVLELVDQLPTFTEPLDNNRSSDLQVSSSQAGVFELVRDKVVLPAGDHCDGFIIPAGTRGCQPKGGELIRWNSEFSGWKLFHCLLDWLLVRIQQRNVPSVVQVGQAEAIIDLVTHLLEADWSVLSKLQPITDCLYPLISSLCTLTQPPLSLLAACLKCITIMAAHQPKQVWQRIQTTGFLPHTGNVYRDISVAISGEGIYPAEYGKLLAGQEQPTGEYPVTLEFLRLVMTLLKGLCTSEVDTATSQDLLACVVFIQREVFAAFHNWRYAQFDDREKVGLCCLDIFHEALPVIGKETSTVVNAASPQPGNGTAKSAVSVRETCLHGFLFTSAGEALLYIVASGIDTLEQRIIDQGSNFNGPAERLSKLIELSLSILNRLLLLKPRDLPPCPLEQALTSHTTGLPHQPHLIGLIAGYIYHRHNPRLPTLATLLLKRVAMVAPMSIFGCLGSQAAAIRDIYLSRLQARSEDERLKVGILELLTVAVETQPGLSELFLNLQKVKPGQAEEGQTSGSSALPSSTPKFEIGEVSCLHAVLDAIEEAKQGTTHSPPDLHCAALGFLQALWQDCRESALSVLRARPKFWVNVTAPLFQDLKAMKGRTQGVNTNIKICAYAFKILTLECYHVSSEHLEGGLKVVLNKLKQEGRYVSWSECIKELLESEAGHLTDLEEYLIREHELLVLIQAWRTLLLVTTSTNGKVIEMSDVKVQSSILSDIAASIHSQSCRFDSVLNQKACSLLSNLYMSLLTKWSRTQTNQWKQVNTLVTVLERITKSDSPGLGPAATSIMVALTTLLKHRTSKQALHVETMESLLGIISIALQQSSTFYMNPPKNATHAGLVGDSDEGAVLGSGWGSDPSQMKNGHERLIGTRGTANGRERREKDFTGAQHASKYSMPTVAAYLLDELLVREQSRTEVWLPLVRQHGILSLLLTTLQSCIQTKRGIHYAEAVLLLLLDLASIPQAAECLKIRGLVQQLCLPLLLLHQQNGEAGLTWNNSSKTEQTDSLTWTSIYRQAVSVVTVMLGTLKHHFLQDALDFFGVHRERMIQCLDAVQYNQSRPCLMEAETTSAFIYRLSLFAKDLGCHMKSWELQALLCGLTSLTHCCVALLIRPRLLQYLSEKSSKNLELGKQQPTALTMRVTPLRLSQQVSVTDLTDNKITIEVQHIQARLLVILGHSLAALRHFSPDLLTILLNPSVDILEYPVLLSLGFSTPALDQEIQPSFGMLLSCVNTCVQLLNKLDSNRALSLDESTPSILALSEPSAPIRHRCMDRSVIKFVLETAVELMMVQGLRCLKDPSLPVRDRQLLKRELGTELGTFLQCLQRHFRRGGAPTSPSSASPSGMLRTPSYSGSSSGLSKSTSHALFSEAPEQAFFRVVQHFMHQILR